MTATQSESAKIFSKIPRSPAKNKKQAAGLTLWAWPHFNRFRQHEASVMHGNPHWFGKRGITFTAPTTWRGWFYLAIWGAGMAFPALMFNEMHRQPEMFIWLGVSGWAFLRDVRRMRREVSGSASSELFYIDDARDVTRMQPPRRWWRFTT